MNIPKAFLLHMLQILVIQKSWKTSGDLIPSWFCRRNDQYLPESTKMWLWILGVKREIQNCFVPLRGDHPIIISIPQEMKITSSTCSHYLHPIPHVTKGTQKKGLSFSSQVSFLLMELQKYFQTSSEQRTRAFRLGRGKAQV